MRKKKLIYVCDFIDTCAPLLLRNRHGNIIPFDDWVTMYQVFLRQLQSEFPRGYIELGHYLATHFQMKNVESGPIVQQCKNRHGQQEVIMIRWDALEKEDFDNLAKFAQSLHYVTETMFRLDLFKEAFNKFKNGRQKTD